MKSSIPLKLTPLAIFIASAMPAFAATNTPDTNITQMDTVEVWATQISNDNSIAGSDIAMKQANHLSDLLRDEAGVDIGGSHSLNQSINIRGLAEQKLEITIDGANQANNVFHHAGNLLINPDILKQVDIRLGNNSVINGGLGGGVAFETKNAQDLLRDGEQFGARIFGGYATNDYHNYSGTAYGQLTDNIDTLVYYSALDHNNPKDGDGNEQIGKDGKTENYLAKVGMDLSETQRLELSYDFYQDAGDYTIKSNMGSGDFDHEQYIRDIKYTRETIALNHDILLGDTEVDSTLYRNEMDYASNSSHGIVDVYGFKTLAETAFYFGDMEHIVLYGGEILHEESKSKDGGTVSGREKSKGYALYIEDQIQLTNAWSVTGGARYNSTKLDMKATDKTYTDTTFGLATEYQINKQWTTHASATQLFKAPAMTGSFIASGSEFNPNLKAQTGINYETGINFTDNDFIGLDQAGFFATLFRTEIDDYIDDTMTAKSRLYSNEGDVVIQGFETGISGKLGNVSSKLSYSHSDSEFTKVYDGSSFAKGQALEDEVGDSIALNVAYDMPALDMQIAWTSQIVMDLDKDVEQDSEKEGYDVHDIKLTWTPRQIKDLNLNASLENIFNEQYGAHASHDFGYTDYEPGRNFKVSAAYVF